jgi:hypothetical protein
MSEEELQQRNILPTEEVLGVYVTIKMSEKEEKTEPAKPNLDKQKQRLLVVTAHRVLLYNLDYVKADLKLDEDKLTN